MVTVHREAGFRIVIRTNDHPPPHVHVQHADGEAKIELDPVRVVEVYGLSKSQVRTAMDMVKAKAFVLLTEWRQIHG